MLNVNSPISGNILIADDTPSNITVLKDVLEARGHKIRPATSGEIALSTIQKENPDLILLDVRLPGMDGYEVCRKLKAQPQTEDIPVIFSSVASEPEDKVLGFQAGGVDYVTKPIQVEEVIARVETHLKLHAMEEALRNSERQMRLIADNTPACISYVGMDDLRYRFVNRRHEGTAGMSREEIIGKHIREVIGESNYQYALKYIEEVKAGRTTSYVNEFDVEQGKRWINVNYVPDFDEDGQVRALVVSSYDITDLKQAEEALRQSEEKYRLIAENVEDVIFTLDMNLTYTYVSPSVKFLRGYEPSEVIGRHIRETLSEESLLNASRLIAAELQLDGQEGSSSDRATRVELRMKRKDGSTVWTEVKAAFLRDSNGAPTGILGVTRDISERKRAEEALRNQTYQLASRVKELNCLYGISKTTEGRDVPLEETLQKVVDLISPSWQFPDITCARITFNGQELRTQNFGEPVSKLSSEITVHGRICGLVEVGYLEERPEVDEGPFLNEERRLIDEIAERLGLIIERLKAEEALRESEARYKTLYKEAKATEELYNSLLNSTLDAIVTYDPEGKVTYVNEGFTKLFGWVEEELTQGVPYTPESERELTMRNVTRVIRGGEALKDFETKRLTKAGGLVDVSISASRFNDHEGCPAGMLVILRDISERIRAEKELAEALNAAEQLRDEAQAASRAKSEFVANMSHEIRTPMNAIMGMTDLALRSDVPPKLRDYLTKIRTSSQSLLRIINDILDFSKIEAGRLDIEHVRFDLRNVIRNMSAVVCASEQCRDIEFLTAIGSDVPCGLVGDPLRLEQVLTNLANNAVKFTPEGEVLVKVESKDATRDRARLAFSVQDTGIEIPEDMLDTLFRPFTQAVGSTTRKFGGSGLGLTICKRLIDMMGGAIQVQSEPGRGSVFSFELEFDVQPEAEEQTLPTPDDMVGMRVLVVDDNSTSRVILLEILKSFSFDASAVSSGEQALEELIAGQRTKPYALVLLDWRMPGIDGIETARRIDREDRLSGRIPKIIMITAFGTEEVKKQAEEAGLDGFLAKPVQPSTLLDTIMEVFGKESPGLSRAAQEKAHEAMVADHIRGARILVAEDNEINRQVAREILEYAGASVEIAWNGKEAVEALKKSEFDAVLMDIQMPEMDGYEATRLIRSDDRFADLPVIAMTAHAMAGDREKSIESGMNDHVSKPINAALLLGTLGKWLNFSDAEPPSDESFPEDVDRGSLLPDAVPGIDVGSAVDRLRGNTTLLKRLLLDFAKNYTGSGRQLRAAVDRRDFVAARSLAHAVRGAAGNLSATALHNAASDLETTALKRNHQECAKRLPIFERALQQVCESIASLEEKTAPKSAERPMPEERSEKVDVESVSRDMRELARLASANQLRTVKYLASVKDNLMSVFSHHDLQLLEEALENLEFDSALELLKRRADTLGFRL